MCKANWRFISLDYTHDVSGPDRLPLDFLAAQIIQRIIPSNQHLGVILGFYLLPPGHTLSYEAPYHYRYNQRQHPLHYLLRSWRRER